MRILVDETAGSEGGSQMGFALEKSQVGEIRLRKPGPSAFDRHFQARPESSLARYTVLVFPPLPHQRAGTAGLVLPVTYI
jgi:hypothetical protein